MLCIDLYRYTCRYVLTIYNVCAKLNTVHHKNKQKENFMSERTSTAVLDGPLKDTPGSIDTLDTSEAALVGMPENAESIETVEAHRDAEARLDPAERKEYLKEMIAKDRNQLAKLGAKRGTRIRNRKKGEKAEFYEYVHGSYNDKVKELGRLELAETLESDELSSDDKKHKVIEYLFKEQKELRDLTTEKLEGTPMGKVVKWMNSGGRLKKFMKVAGVGLIAGAAGMATGGLAGGFIAAGVAGGSRMFRGFVAAEGKNGRALNDVDTSTLNGVAFENDASSLLDAGTAALGESYNDEIKGRQKKVRRAFGRGALYAGAGAIIGAVVHTAGSGTANAKPLDGSNPNFGNHAQPSTTEIAEVKPGEHVMLASHSETIDAFTYNPSENPFYAPNKLGIHDMGAPLNADPNLDGGRPAGFNDLTQNRWMNSPEQFASIASAMGMDNLPDDMASANALAEHFKVAPGDMANMHERVMGILNDPNTHISTQNIVNPYASEYGVDMGHGNMDLAWDEYVNHGGTKTVIEFTDGNGIRRVIELRNECGGQRIEEMATPPAPVYQAPVSYEQSQSGGTGNGEYQSYDDSPPVEQDTPPGTQSPPSTDVPPAPPLPPPLLPPPVGPPLAPKIPGESWNVNNLIDSWRRDLNDQFGSGALRDAEPTPDNYSAPSAPNTSSEPAPGALTNGAADPHNGNSQQPNIPRAQIGINGSGNTAGSATDSQGAILNNGEVDDK